MNLQPDAAVSMGGCGKTVWGRALSGSPGVSHRVDFLERRGGAGLKGSVATPIMFMIPAWGEENWTFGVKEGGLHRDGGRFYSSCTGKTADPGRVSDSGP